MLSGTFHLATGERFEAATGGPGFPAGSYLVMPAWTAHYAQIHGVGPSGITYVNPADDPRKR